METSKTAEKEGRLFSDKELARLLKKTGLSGKELEKSDAQKEVESYAKQLVKALEGNMNEQGLSKDQKWFLIRKNQKSIRKQAKDMAAFVSGISDQPVSELDALRSRREALFEELKEHPYTPPKGPVSTTLSWDEKYPASYLYTPSEAMIRLGLELKIGRVDVKIAELTAGRELSEKERKDIEVASMMKLVRSK
jgi:hypothetical protein